MTAPQGTPHDPVYTRKAPGGCAMMFVFLLLAGLATVIWNALGGGPSCQEMYDEWQYQKDRGYPAHASRAFDDLMDADCNLGDLR